MLVALKPAARLHGDALRESLRGRFSKELPGVEVSFEAGDIISQVMSFGSPTPLEVAGQGPGLRENPQIPEKAQSRTRQNRKAPDLQVRQTFDAPTEQR